MSPEPTPGGSEARLRQVVEDLADSFFLVDQDGRVLDVNTAAYRSRGYTRDETVGRSVSDFAAISDDRLRQIYEAVTPDNPISDGDIPF